MEFDKYLTYCTTSPTGLVWKKSRGNIQSGSIAGNLTVRGYWRVCFCKKLYMAHRIIWEMFHGPIGEGLYIDHIDGVRTNNDISNLRLVGSVENGRNRKGHNNNSSGYTGVLLQTSKRKDGSLRQHWTAYWTSIDGYRKSKCFAVDTYGYHRGLTLAVEYRTKMIFEMNSQGAGYTERHGT